VADAICRSSDESHDALLALYRRRFEIQIEIADTEAIMACWQT
jgi:hypothetical protein